MAARRTIALRLLEAARVLTEGKTAKEGVFTDTQLIVDAWAVDPEMFGLAGFEHVHPDANKVVVALSGPRGLVGQGYLDRVAPNHYRLTERGRIRLGDRTSPLSPTPAPQPQAMSDNFSLHYDPTESELRTFRFHRHRAVRMYCHRVQKLGGRSPSLFAAEQILEEASA